MSCGEEWLFLWDLVRGVMFIGRGMFCAVEAGVGFLCVVGSC